MTMPNSDSSALTDPFNDAIPRAGMYGFLSRLWSREPDEGLINEINAPSVEVVLPDGFNRPKLVDIDELQADYTQLFIGPKDQLPPYQSVWQQGQFEGDAAVTMRKYLEVIQGVRAEGYEMPDSLGLQFEVMHTLLLSNSDPDRDYDALCDLIRSYFHDCLRWTGPLTTAVQNRATTGFFADVAKMTAAFLHEETCQLETAGQSSTVPDGPAI